MRLEHIGDEAPEADERFKPRMIAADSVMNTIDEELNARQGGNRLIARHARG